MWAWFTEKGNHISFISILCFFNKSRFKNTHMHTNNLYLYLGLATSLIFPVSSGKLIWRVKTLEVETLQVNWTPPGGSESQASQLLGASLKTQSQICGSCVRVRKNNTFFFFFSPWQTACLPTEQRKFNIQGGQFFKAGTPEGDYDDLSVILFLLPLVKKISSNGLLQPLALEQRQVCQISCRRITGVLGLHQHCCCIAAPAGRAAPTPQLPASLPGRQQLLLMLLPLLLLEKMFPTAEHLGPATAMQSLEIIVWNGEGCGAGNWALKHFCYKTQQKCLNKDKWPWKR